jgi:hypothetical protein
MDIGEVAYILKTRLDFVVKEFIATAATACLISRISGAGVRYCRNWDIA